MNWQISDQYKANDGNIYTIDETTENGFLASCNGLQAYVFNSNGEALTINVKFLTQIRKGAGF